MINQSQCLITGITGYLGNMICRQFNANQLKPYGLIRQSSTVSSRINFEPILSDVSDYKNLSSVCDNVTTIIHSASVFSFSRNCHKEIWKTNVEGTQNLINLCLKKNIKLIYTSSILTTSISLREKVFSKNKIQKEHSYIASKFIAEDHIIQATKNGLQAVIINPGMLVGGNLINSKLGPSGELFLNCVNKRFPFYIDGIWPWVSVEDTANLHILALNKGFLGKRYPIVAPGCLNINETFKLIKKKTGFRPILKLPIALVREMARFNQYLIDNDRLKKFSYNTSLSLGGLLFSSIKDYDLDISCTENDFNIKIKSLAVIIDDLLKGYQRI